MAVKRPLRISDMELLTMQKPTGIISSVELFERGGICVKV